MASFNEDKLDSFLRKNTPPPPGAPLGEKQRIWRAIEAEAGRGSFSWRSFFSLPAFRLTAVPALIALVVVGIALEKKRARDAHVEKVLSAALAWQVESLEDDSGF